MNFKRYLKELFNSGGVEKIVYHGSNVLFSKFEASKARIANDLYGGGIAYFADSIKIAKNYAKQMAKKSGHPYVYTIKLKLRKVFDVDSTFTGKTLTELLPKDHEKFARSAGLLNYGSNKIDVLTKLKNGTISITGEQVFRGLSNGMHSTKTARDALVDAGYDGLRYNQKGLENHSVYIAYYPESIVITSRGKIVYKEKVNA